MSERSMALKRLYCVFGIAILVYCAYLTFILVMHIWHPSTHTGEHHGPILEMERYAVMVEGIEDAVKAPAVKDISAVGRKYEFHQTDNLPTVDEQNLCVECHGVMVHEDKKEIRAFLNMHSSFMGCETCHIRIENPGPDSFEWYQKVSGERVPAIQITEYLGRTDWKINAVPMEGGAPAPYDSDRMESYVADFLENLPTMSVDVKEAGLKVIHQPMTRLERSVNCEECHTAIQEDTYLPLEALGYPEGRRNRIVGNEVVGMIKRYQKFYMPGFLTPNEGM